MIDYPDFALAHEHCAQQTTEGYGQTNANILQNFYASEASIALLIENDAAPPIEEARLHPIENFTTTHNWPRCHSMPLQQELQTQF